MVLAAGSNLFYTGLFAIELPWAVVPLFVYGFGMSLVMPPMSVLNLEMFPRSRGLAASLQGFLFMLCFAIGSGVICPILFGSAFRLAVGAAVGLALSLICWTAGRRSETTPLDRWFRVSRFWTQLCHWAGSPNC